MNTEATRNHRPRSEGRIAFGLFILISLASSAAQGTTRFVPETYPTIQDAIDHSVPGDTVLLSPGTYSGPGNRDIELRGKDLVVTSRAGAEETVIDCQHAGRGFYLHETETRAARIEKITIQNGEAYDGGAIYCSLSSPTISECRLLNNHASAGAGLYSLVFDGVLDRCLIYGNQAGDYGGGLCLTLGFCQISNCVITGNWSYEGGGIFYNDGYSPTLVNCTITANLATDGGGIYSMDPVSMERCILWGNCAFLDAKDFWVGAGADIHCSDVDLTGVDVVFGVVQYDPYCVHADPVFCGPWPCGLTVHGDWTLNGDSPCVPEHSPCGQLIGALPQACPWVPPNGACCFPDGTCLVTSGQECEVLQGLYMGDSTLCQPNPCQPVPIESTTWGRIKMGFRDKR